jgi:hypothetical protein
MLYRRRGLLQAWGRQLGVTRNGIWPPWRALVLTCPLRLPAPAWPTSWPDQKPNESVPGQMAGPEQGV